MAKFDSEFFGLVFQGFRHPENSRPKFTSRIVGIPLQCHFIEPKIYSRRFSPYGGDKNISEELKKAVAVSEEKIQQRSRRRGQFSSSRFPCRKVPQTFAGIAFRAAGKSGNHFPAASKFAGKPFQQGISDSHSLLEFSENRTS